MESSLNLLKHNLFYLFLFPFWLLKGRAHLKRQIAQRANLDIACLPFNRGFLNFLKQEHKRGRPIVLATASDSSLAERVADHLGIFTEVLASDGKTNLAGDHKLRALVTRYGEKGFDYAGNARIDLKLWVKASHAILVSPSPGVKAAVGRLTEVDRVIDDNGINIRNYLSALRPHQWLKNLLLFVPLIAAHQVGEIGLLSQNLMAFIAFCLCASSGYIANDLLDLEVDRRHPHKCKRPFAAGSIPLTHGALIIFLLLLAAIGIALLLPLQFLILLLGYYLVSLSYSVWMKKIVLLDVLVLAGLYTLRIIAGGAAIAVPLSFWLLVFSMFIFLGLAMVKRYAELLRLRNEGGNSTQGRGYQVADLDTIFSLGSASGVLSVLVLALYINSEHVRNMYAHPEALWLLCPLLFYWIGRIWLVSRRGEMQEDPLLFALRDRASLWLAVAGIGVLLLAI